MSALLIGAGAVAGLLALLIVSTRVMLLVRASKLKGKPASTVYQPSARRISSGKKTLLYFYTPSCGACRMQEPILQKMSSKLGDVLFKIDATRAPEAASAYGVLGVPFFVFIEKGTVVKASAGVQSEGALSSFIDA